MVMDMDGRSFQNELVECGDENDNVVGVLEEWPTVESHECNKRMQWVVTWAEMRLKEHQAGGDNLNIEPFLLVV